MASSADSGGTGPPPEAGPGMDSASPQGSVTSVKVAVRVRPLVSLETAAGCQECMFGDSDNNQVVITGDNRRRKFDHVFAADSTQEQVYESTTLPLVKRCLEGYNATVLAYGQTGSGKTFTVGNAYTVNGSPEDAGIIPRAVTDLFQRMDQLRQEGVKASVHASFMEVINEEIKDLIGGEGVVPAALPLRENMQGEVTVAGLSKHEISSAEELQSLLERGALCRTTASTNMNAHSSRSHAICTLSFEMVRAATEQTEETVTSSQFHLVDLAGSERAKKTGAEGKRLREGININKGLLALGNVISALAEGCGSGGGHVPYRDSKLTRLLQGSLGGNSHTLMIACISPADSNMGESVNTMRYAERAMNIQNTAVKNEDVSGPPVSYAEVMALRKQVRVMEVELVQARLSGLAGGFGFGGGGQGMDMGMGGRGVSGKAYRGVQEEAAQLRRGQADLQRRVLEETRHATSAVEGEMSARVESDTWRLRCEQLSAVLKEAAPSALAGLPSWATGEKEDASGGDDFSGEEGEAGGASSVGKEQGAAAAAGTAAGLGPAGSLARELRQKVFELQEVVYSLEGKLRLADEARLERGGDGDGDNDDDDDAVSTVVAVYDGTSSRRRRYGGGDGAGASTAAAASGQGSCTESPMGEECSFDSFDSEVDGGGGMFGEKGGRGHEGEGPSDDDDGGAEEIRRVDEEIESKERELQMKARQAQAYEAMKGQFEGLLGRLQGEVTSLQSERDGLLHKLPSSGGGSGSSGSGATATGGAALARMKARVNELEGRIKENRKKVKEHQRAERERAAAAKEAERLRAEVAEAKQRRAELQRTHRAASTRFMKETRQLHLKDARMQRDGERMQWQVKKLQESQERTQAALKRKMEEHSIAMRKVRTLQSQRQGGRGGAAEGAGAGAGGRGDGRHPSVKEAKKAEMEAWLATEIEEDTAVQRAKRALKAQLKLRGEAAGRAQALRDANNNTGDKNEEGVTVTVVKTETETGGGEEESGGVRQRELQELEGRIATASKAIKGLQTFLVSTDRKNTAPASRLAAGVSTAGGGAGNARWGRVRTAWDSKTALSLLFSEAVKFKVLGMDFAEASSLKDMDVRRLLRENSSLRSAAASAAAAPGNTIGGSGGRAAAMQAAMQAAETEVNAAIGDEGVGVEDGDGGLDVKQELDEEEKEEDDGDRYEQGEHSFVVISDTEEEEEEEDSDDDDDDEDDEWLPDALLASKKRSSSNSSTAPTITTTPTGGDGVARGRYRDSNGAGGSRGERGSRTSSGNKSDRSSAGSVVSASPKSTVWSGIDWNDLNSYTNAQLKDFLRLHGLPVSGKKEILVNRLLEYAREFGCLLSSLPSSPASPSPTPPSPKFSPSDSDFLFSMPGVSGVSTPAGNGDHDREGEEEGKAGKPVELSPEVEEAAVAVVAAVAAAVAADEPGEGANTGGGVVEGEGEESRPEAAGLQDTAFRKRLKALSREKDLAAKRTSEGSSSSSRGSGDSEDPNGAIRKVDSGGGSSRNSSTGSSSSRGSGSRSQPTQARPTGGIRGGGGGGSSGTRQGNVSVHRPSSSKQRAIDAGKAAVAAATMGPPAVRTPLGSLGSGNGSSSGNRRAGLAKAAVKSKSATSTTKQPFGGGGGGSFRGGGVSGSATAQRKVGHGSVSSSSTDARRTPVGVGNTSSSSSSRKFPTAHKGAAGPRGSATGPGKVDRVRSSSGIIDTGKGKEATIASGGTKRPAASVAAVATTSDHAKRLRVDGVSGSRKTVPANAKTPSFVKPTKSSAGAPSFMKPTKTSGARTFGSDKPSTAQAARHGPGE